VLFVVQAQSDGNAGIFFKIRCSGIDNFAALKLAIYSFSYLLLLVGVLGNN